MHAHADNDNKWRRVFSLFFDLDCSTPTSTLIISCSLRHTKETLQKQSKAIRSITYKARKQLLLTPCFACGPAVSGSYNLLCLGGSLFSFLPIVAYLLSSSRSPQWPNGPCLNLSLIFPTFFNALFPISILLIRRGASFLEWR